MTQHVQVGGVPLSPGKTITITSETSFGPGTKSVLFSTDSDSVLFSLWVDSLAAGQLDIVVYTLTEGGKEVVVLNFPSITGPTSELLLRKPAVTMSRLRVEITTTGAATFELRARGLNAGESTARISGQNNWKVSQVDVTTTPAPLFPLSLTDRNGLLIKNTSSVTIWLAETSLKAGPSTGWPLGAGESLAMDLSSGQSVYAAADSGTADVRVVEAGGG